MAKFRYAPTQQRDEYEGPSYKLGQCAVPGCWGVAALSHSTKGGGPYYCKEHFRDQSALRHGPEEREKENAKRRKLNQAAIFWSGYETRKD